MGPDFQSPQITNASFSTGRTIYVDDAVGSDSGASMGVRGRRNRSFRTPAGAQAVAQAGDKIRVRPGSYLDHGLGKHLVNWELDEGVAFPLAAASAGETARWIFGDNGSAMTYSVIGRGVIEHSDPAGSFVDGIYGIWQQHASSNIRFQGKTLRCSVGGSITSACVRVDEGLIEVDVDETLGFGGLDGGSCYACFGLTGKAYIRSRLMTADGPSSRLLSAGDGTFHITFDEARNSGNASDGFDTSAGSVYLRGNSLTGVGNLLHNQISNGSGLFQADIFYVHSTNQVPLWVTGPGVYRIGQLISDTHEAINLSAQSTNTSIHVDKAQAGGTNPAVVVQNLAPMTARLSGRFLASGTNSHCILLQGNQPSPVIEAGSYLIANGTGNSIAISSGSKTIAAHGAFASKAVGAGITATGLTVDATVT